MILKMLHRLFFNRNREKPTLSCFFLSYFNLDNSKWIIFDHKENLTNWLENTSLDVPKCIFLSKIQEVEAGKLVGFYVLSYSYKEQEYFFSVQMGANLNFKALGEVMLMNCQLRSPLEWETEDPCDRFALDACSGPRKDFYSFHNSEGVGMPEHVLHHFLAVGGEGEEEKKRVKAKLDGNTYLFEHDSDVVSCHWLSTK